MIELKAESLTKDGEKGVQVSYKTEGTGEEIVNEVLICIQSLMGNLKKEAPSLHALAISTIADNIWILLGERKEEDSLENLLMSQLMSKSIIGKELN